MLFGFVVVDRVDDTLGIIGGGIDEDVISIEDGDELEGGGPSEMESAKLLGGSA